MATARIKHMWRTKTARVKAVHNRNLSTFKRQPWTEISGSFGDIGTFIPIFIALVSANEGRWGRDEGLISASSTLVFSGLFNVFTGVYFGIPLPVQPMKAIAAVAIASPHDYNQAKYASAGIFVACVVAVLSWTGLIKWFTKAVPLPIVKGIQVGAGLSLITSALSKLPLKARDWDWALEWSQAYEDTITVLIVLAFLLFCSTRPRIPFVLTIVVFFVVAFIVTLLVQLVREDYNSYEPQFSIWHPSTIVPRPDDFLFGAFNAGLGQVPLTTLNSIVAVVYLAEDLLPEAPAPSATAVGSSVAAMNLLGCWFKAMPVCHGSGGLAAQYRFGARSGASVIFLGLLKIVLGLFASEFVTVWCQRVVPDAVLAVLLVLAGVELLKMGENLNGEGARDLWKEDNSGSQEPGSRSFALPDAALRMRRWVIMLVTVGTIIGTKNDGIGFIVGLAVHWSYQFQDWVETRQRAHEEGRIQLG